MVITVTVVGPFEEEEEGTGIASEVVKVQGEDPATPGLLPKGIDPGTVTIPQYRYNKTKQHTHSRAPLCHRVQQLLQQIVDGPLMAHHIEDTCLWMRHPRDTNMLGKVTGTSSVLSADRDRSRAF